MHSGQRLTQSEEVARRDALDAAIDEDVGGGEVSGEAEEAVLEELHGGPHDAPEVWREAGRVDEEHRGRGRGIYARRSRGRHSGG